VSLNLKAYRLRRGMTQVEVVAEIHKRAVARGDVQPGLCPCAVSRHENGHKHPSLYYQAWYCELYGANPVELGFCLALPGENSHPEDVDRREFLASTASLMLTAALPSMPDARVGTADVDRLRQSIASLYELDNQHGGGAVQAVTVSTFNRIRGLIEDASYNQATGRALRELAGLTAENAGWIAFDADRHDDAQRWWLEAMKWARLADADSVGAVTMASMARQASDQGRPREAIDLASSGASTAATPRLKSVLLAREALGHAGAGDATSARAALRRARPLAERPRHEADPSWLEFYGPADFAGHERRAMLMLGDTAAAETAARTALDLNDPVAYPRNRALYLIGLANVLAQRREIDEGTAVAKQATVAATGLNSPRVTRELRTVTQSLATAA
jgi:hypothetical protein